MPPGEDETMNDLELVQWASIAGESLVLVPGT